MMNDEEHPGDPMEIPQDDYVMRLRPVPTEPPRRVLVLRGLLGDSDRPGHRRLYLSRSLDHYAEFAAGDVLAIESVPRHRSPLVGTVATQVTLRRDAAVAFTYERRAGPVDEFDLDLRLGAAHRTGATPFDFTDVQCYTGNPGDVFPCQIDTFVPRECAVNTLGGCTVPGRGCPFTDNPPTYCKPYSCDCTDRGATCEGGNTCDGGPTCGTENTCNNLYTCHAGNTCVEC